MALLRQEHAEPSRYRSILNVVQRFSVHSAGLVCCSCKATRVVAIKLIAMLAATGRTARADDTSK